jgi:hypothetical protein
MITQVQSSILYLKDLDFNSCTLVEGLTVHQKEKSSKTEVGGL